MTKALDELITTLTLEERGPDIFCGRGSQNDGADGTYGGHLLGQATAAAICAVDEQKKIHSLHAYFLNAGQPGMPIEYQVERLRDGRSFCSRRVRGLQEGRVLLDLNASFCLRSKGLIFEATRPEDFEHLPSPDDLPRYPELMAMQDTLPFREDWALEEHGVDVRVVNAPWAERGLSTDGGIRMWVRADGQLEENSAIHEAVLAYQSDESLADNVLAPFNLTWNSPNMFMVSLDHALWFHQPINFNCWHFVEQWPVSVGMERGVATGKVWNKEGILVASFTQEALMRVQS